MKFASIADWADNKEYDVNFMCEYLGVSRSGYYKWRQSEPSERDKTDSFLTALIKKLYEASHGNAGVRRIHAGLRA